LRRDTVAYAPGQFPSFDKTGTEPTHIEVTGESTLAAAARLAKTGPVLALNFASAKNPGGGFLSGAQAQEESLARASTLYASLQGQPLYERALIRTLAFGAQPRLAIAASLAEFTGGLSVVADLDRQRIETR
jgi:hypothetical protein